MSEAVHYWSDLAQLTHALQLAEFGFCMCEDLDGAEPPFSDCPEALQNCGHPFTYCHGCDSNPCDNSRHEADA